MATWFTREQRRTFHLTSEVMTMNTLVQKLPGAARILLGLVFFVWVGVFNMSLVAQFWSFASDLCTEE